VETAVLKNRLYVPRHAILPEHFTPFEYRLIDGYSKEAFSVRTYEEFENHYGFARGDLNKLHRVFGDRFEIEDYRSASPIKYGLKFSGTLTKEQADTLSRWIDIGYGMLQAPPRWGKTVWMTALMCKLRQRTLMLAHQEDLCNQLEETVRKFTNINELEEQHGIKLCGVLKEWDDFFPILTLSTYQCFAVSEKGRRVLREKKDYFGLVMVDEAHRCKTEMYTDVVGVLNSAYRCGVTATPKRKDRMHVVISDVLGPVTAKAEGEQLHVRYSWEYTETEVEEFSNWTVMWNRLVKKRKRTRKIATKVVEDVRAGHFVLVTTERYTHIDDLREMIKEIDEDITIGELSGRVPDRDGFRLKAKRGDYQVVLAMSKIVELGYNVPRWSSFHNTLPMTNPENWYQRISRIRTPMEPAFDGDDYVKPDPIARVWIDAGHKAIWAYKSVVRKENDKRGFECLNPDPKPKRMRRVGAVTFVPIEEGDERTDQAK